MSFWSKYYLFLPVFLSHMAFGQLDSLHRKNVRNRADSLIRLSSGQWIEDSLKIDTWGSSLKAKIKMKSSIDSLELKGKIDSLKSLNLDASRYERKMDSVMAIQGKLTGEIDAKQRQLLDSTKSRISKWQSKVKSKFGLDTLQSKTDLKLPSKLKIPDAGGLSKDLALPDMGEIPELGGMPKLSNADFQSMKVSPDLLKFDKLSFENPLDGLGNPLKDIGKVQQQIEGLGKSISGATELAKNADKQLESSVMKMDQMKEVKDQLKVGDQLQKNEFMDAAKKLENPEEARKELLAKAQQQAVNHFAGKEKELQAAMENMAKYKKKYSSVSSLKDLELKKRNAMHGVPFIERLIPGIAIQIQKPNNLLVDFNPYMGYRVSGIISSGLGWNQRVAYDTRKNQFLSSYRIYGPRVYTEIRLWKGFFPRLEGELMNTRIPPVLAAGEERREWVPGVLLGLKKEYRFTKNIKGTAFVMFNLFNSKHKSPYQDVLNMRFGFEFPFKKKLATKENEK